VKDFRIVFVGAVEASRHCLPEVLKCGFKPAAIFTVPPAKSGLHSDYADLSDIAAVHHIPIHYAEDLSSPENAALIAQYRPDAIFVWGWSRIIRENVLAIPRLGSIGLHPSLLPENRGRHPIIWAIALGLPYTGLTFFWMDEGADTGDILAQQRIELSPDEDARSLYEKVKRTASEMIPRFLPMLANGTAQRVPQDHSKANSWRKRGKVDGAIDFRMSALTIDRLVRALTRPYVGAHVTVGGQEIRIWRTRVEPLAENSRNREFGRVLQVKDREIFVRTGDGTIVLVEHEFECIPVVGSCF